MQIDIPAISLKWQMIIFEFIQAVTARIIYYILPRAAGRDT